MRDFGTKIDDTAPAPSGVLTAEEDNVRFREGENLVSTAGIPLDPAVGPDTDFKMQAQAVARYAAGGAVFYDDAGTADTYVLTSPSGVDGFVMPKDFFEGMEIEFVPGNSSTGAVTVNANALGVKSMLRTNGDPTEENDVVAGVHCAARYSVSDDAFLIAPWALREAAEVSSGGGSGVTGSYLNLLIYPEVITNDGVLSLTSPSAGNLTVSDGGRIIHRGWREYLTTDYDIATRQFTTAANKTYHLRWSPANGFQLKDVVDGSYNAGSLPEDDLSMDTTYDDMIVARVATDGSNNLAITALMNKEDLKFSAFPWGVPASVATTGSGSDGVVKITDFTLNWGRAGTVTATGIAGQTGGAVLNGYANDTYVQLVVRYGFRTIVQSDFNSVVAGPHSSVHVTALA